MTELEILDQQINATANDFIKWAIRHKSIYFANDEALGLMNKYENLTQTMFVRLLTGKNND